MAIGLGPFNIPLPKRTPIDPVALGTALAAPEVARQQTKASIFGNIARLPQQIQEIREKRQLSGLETRGKEAEIKLKEARAQELLGRKPKGKTFIRDIGGQLSVIKLDSAGDILETKGLGPSSQTTGKIQDAFQTFNSADNLLKQIKNLASKVIIAQSSLEIPGQATNISLGALTRSDPNAVAFQNSLKAFSSMLTRAAGEKGVLTTQDVERIISSLPNQFDTIESSASKLKTLEDLYESSKTSSIETLSKPASELLKTGGGAKIQPQLQLKTKKSAEQRFNELTKSGVPDESAYKILRGEGYRGF